MIQQDWKYRLQQLKECSLDSHLPSIKIVQEQLIQEIDKILKSLSKVQSFNTDSLTAQIDLAQCFLKQTPEQTQNYYYKEFDDLIEQHFYQLDMQQKKKIQYFKLFEQFLGEILKTIQIFELQYQQNSIEDAFYQSQSHFQQSMDQFLRRIQPKQRQIRKQDSVLTDFIFEEIQTVKPIHQIANYTDIFNPVNPSINHIIDIKPNQFITGGWDGHLIRFTYDQIIQDIEGYQSPIKQLDLLWNGLILTRDDFGIIRIWFIDDGIMRQYSETYLLSQYQPLSSQNVKNSVIYHFENNSVIVIDTLNMSQKLISGQPLSLYNSCIIQNDESLIIMSEDSESQIFIQEFDLDTYQFIEKALNLEKIEHFKSFILPQKNYKNVHILTQYGNILKFDPRDLFVIDLRLEFPSTPDYISYINDLNMFVYVIDQTIYLRNQKKTYIQQTIIEKIKKVIYCNGHLLSVGEGEKEQLQVFKLKRIDQGKMREDQIEQQEIQNQQMIE